MAKVTLTVQGFRCERCNHQWTPRVAGKEPRVCPNPKCHSPYWNTPRRSDSKKPAARAPKRKAG
jgi:hypothetical protein